MRFFAALPCSLAVLASLSSAQTLPARRSSNYNANSRDGRFDLRVRVDGACDFYIRAGEIRYRVRSGAPPSDEGSEYRQELPLGTVYGLNLEQRDGRNPIRIVEEPSRRNNWTLALAIDDPQGGSARYNARITWQNSSQNPFEGGNRDRFGGDQDRFTSPGGLDAEAPAWAVGVFRGFSPAFRTEMELTIHSNGDVVARTSDRRMAGVCRRGQLRLEGFTFDIGRERDGIRLTQSGGRSSAALFQRVR